MLTLSADSNNATGVRRRTLRQQIRFGAVSLSFVIILLACLVSLIYLSHANRVATRGYVIKKLELEKNNLVTENEIWRQQVSEAKSLATVRESDVVSKMRVVSDARYIRIDQTVAKK